MRVSVNLLDDALAPLAVCTGHKHPVLCISACSSLGIVVSGAKRKSTMPRSCGDHLPAAIYYSLSL